MMGESNGQLSNQSNYVPAQNYRIELPGWSPKNLRYLALEQSLVRPQSLAWAILLTTLPAPDGNISKSIKTHRHFYEDLKKKLSMDPRTVVGDDPLSQNDESAWNQHFCDNELKALILQDVIRTFPDELYFRDKEVQDLMVRVLFFWSRSHCNVGYRQGMHEVLAPLLLELYLDRKYAPANISDFLKELLDEDYLEHDSYMLFNAVMKGLERFYTTGDVMPNSCGRLPTSKVVHNPNAVVKYLNYVKEEYLVPIDSELAMFLDECNISIELFGIRWLRLLFGREFPRADISTLWGFLFADGPTLPYLHYVIVAMLLAIKNILLSCEPGDVVSVLMRPSPSSVRRVIETALHIRRPHLYPMPSPIALDANNYVKNHTVRVQTQKSIEERSVSTVSNNFHHSLSGLEDIGEGVALGEDVSRELAALSAVRATLPAAAAALANYQHVLPPALAPHVRTIIQLASLLQCRNHTLLDVETALEAAEGQIPDKIVTRRQLVPVSLIGGKRNRKPPPPTPTNQIKEVPLKVFHEAECVVSDSELPCLDPLRLRTE